MERDGDIFVFGEREKERDAFSSRSRSPFIMFYLFLLSGAFLVLRRQSLTYKLSIILKLSLLYTMLASTSGGALFSRRRMYSLLFC